MMQGGANLLLNHGFSLADVQDGEGEEEDDGEAAGGTDGDVHCSAVVDQRFSLT